MLLYAPNNPTPQQLAFITALNHTVILLVCLLVCKYWDPQSIAWWLVFVIPLLVLVTGYWAVFEALRRFIYRKVKLIYKAIHRLKAPKDSPPFQIDMRNHIIDRVEREVVEWAKDWTQEIHYLKRLEEYRREFIDNVSHELKTPIFNIQGYLYTLQDGAWEDPQISMKYLQRAIDNVDRISSIVEDLNHIAQFEAGKVKLEYERFNIHQLVSEVFEDMEMQANQKRIRLEFKDFAAQPFWVLADREMIRRVLLNLLSNSIKYGKERGKTLVSFYEMDKNILVEISDNGRGISEEHLPRLFERFYRVDKGRSREEGGTGLGLAIVKHIVEAHGQAVNVRSRVGVGSTFGFTLEKASK
jgi:two-component system phosphate regulon sensor histidine kinase PhoR